MQEKTNNHLESSNFRKSTKKLYLEHQEILPIMLLPFIQLSISTKCLTDATIPHKEVIKRERQLNQYPTHSNHQDTMLLKKS